MTIQECYEAVGDSYEDVYKRFGNQTLIKKYVVKFIEDTSYSMLKDAYEQQNIEKAYSAAHTLKGVCQNLGFMYLCEPVSKMTELLLYGTMESCKEYMEELEQRYEKFIEILKQIEE